VKAVTAAAGLVVAGLLASSSKLWVGAAGETLPSQPAAILVSAEEEGCSRCPLLVMYT